MNLIIHSFITAGCIYFIALQVVQCQHSLPVKISPLKGSNCPLNVSGYFTEDIGSTVDQLFLEKYGPPCTCSKGVFQRAIYLDMSNSSMQCPSNWRLYNGAVRGCLPANTGTGCSSAVFSSSTPYNHVCGRIIGYQYGTPDAFDQVWGATLNIEEHYVDGVSLTYGAPGSRKHIWTFAAAVYYTDPDFVTHYNCECTNTNYNWNHPLPSFIGNNYFCESGSNRPGFHQGTVFADDPLWDAKGCASTSTCCELNRPPWFCAPLPQTTSEDIEIRICKDQASADEDVIVSLIDIYTSNV